MLTVSLCLAPAATIAEEATPEPPQSEMRLRSVPPVANDTIPAPPPADLVTYERALATCRALVLWLARQYRGKPYYDDMVQAGHVGLFQAVDTWQSDGGSTFVTWARCCIRHAMRDVHKLEARRGMTMGRGTRRGRELQTSSMDAADADGATLHEVLGELATQETAYADAEQARDVRRDVGALSDLERRVLTLRHDEELTQGAAAAVLGVSESRVGQIEKSAIEQLRKRMGVPDPPKARTILHAYNGQALSILGWSRATGIDPHTLGFRVRKGMSIKEALETPVGYRRAKKKAA
jgi:RNA polymerase sigma factor (sigma-70 family)